MGIISDIFRSSPLKPGEINQTAIKDSIKSINQLIKDNDHLENNIKDWELRITNAKAKIKENKSEVVEHEKAKELYEKKETASKIKGVK